MPEKLQIQQIQQACQRFKTSKAGEPAFQREMGHLIPHTISPLSEVQLYQLFLTEAFPLGTAKMPGGTKDIFRSMQLVNAAVNTIQARLNPNGGDLPYAESVRVLDQITAINHYLMDRADRLVNASNAGPNKQVVMDFQATINRKLHDRLEPATKVGSSEGTISVLLYRTFPKLEALVPELVHIKNSTPEQLTQALIKAVDIFQSTDPETANFFDAALWVWMVASAELDLSALSPGHADYINKIRDWHQWMTLQILSDDQRDPQVNRLLGLLSIVRTNIGKQVNNETLFDGLFSSLVRNAYISSKTDRAIFTETIANSEEAQLVTNSTLPDERFQAAVDAYFLQRVVIAQLLRQYYSDAAGLVKFPSLSALQTMRNVSEALIAGENLLTRETADELTQRMSHIQIETQDGSSEIDLTSQIAIEQMETDIDAALEELNATGIQRLRLGRYVCPLSDNIHTQIFGQNAEIEFFSADLDVSDGIRMHFQIASDTLTTPIMGTIRYIRNDIDGEIWTSWDMSTFNQSLYTLTFKTATEIFVDMSRRFDVIRPQPTMSPAARDDDQSRRGIIRPEPIEPIPATHIQYVSTGNSQGSDLQRSTTQSHASPEPHIRIYSGAAALYAANRAYQSALGKNGPNHPDTLAAKQELIAAMQRTYKMTEAKFNSLPPEFQRQFEALGVPYPDEQGRIGIPATFTRHPQQIDLTRRKRIAPRGNGSVFSDGLEKLRELAQKPEE